VANKGVVYVLDGDQMVSRSLADLFDDDGYATRIFTDPVSLYAASEPMIPGCLLLENHLGGEVSGIDVQQELMQRGWTLPVIFHTGKWELHHVKVALRLGAYDFLAKPADPRELLHTVAQAVQHSSTLLQKRDLHADLRARLASLTSRERDICHMVINGQLNKQIAANLGLALVTVKVHRRRVMTKLKADSVADLIRIARTAGLCE
jgi:FixJ family two-component response regulator